MVTLTSGDRVRIRLVLPAGGRLIRGTLASKAAWFDPRRERATFVVLSPGVAGYPGFTSEGPVLATFGPPARTYHVGRYLVLVWHKNLLRELR